jgi:predicted nucleotidyltransferase
VTREPFDLREVRRIVLDRLRGREADVYLYGSWATGRNRRASDIDVGILPRKALPVELWWEIKEALDHSLVVPEVDLVNLSETSAAFRKRVRDEGVLWSASAKESPLPARIRA